MREVFKYGLWRKYPFSKSPAMIRHSNKINGVYPILYFKKAKHATNKEFETALKILGFDNLQDKKEEV